MFISWLQGLGRSEIVYKFEIKTMTTLEIKSDLLNRISLLGRNKLNEVKGYLENLEHEDVELIDWLKLSIEQRARINESIKQLDFGKSTPHETVIKELRKKVKNA